MMVGDETKRPIPMTTPQPPITPPPELRSKWFNEAPKTDLYDYIIEQAAQWGADQELEACCEWLDYNCPSVGVHHLRAARRPKPPSLKEQALALINGNKPYLDDTAMDIIRRALEALPE
jgi:hypothetical protein